MICIKLACLKSLTSVKLKRTGQSIKYKCNFLMRLYNVKSAEVRHLLSSCQEVLAILMGFLLQQASKWLDCHKASRWCRAEAKTITVSTKLDSFIAILPLFFSRKEKKMYIKNLLQTVRMSKSYGAVDSMELPTYGSVGTKFWKKTIFVCTFKKP